MQYSQGLMKPILNQGVHSHPSRTRSIRLAYTAAGLMLLGMAVAFGTSPSTNVYLGTFDDVIESATSPVAVRIATDPQGLAREARIDRGDTVSSLLDKLGIQDQSFRTYLYSNDEADPLFRQLAPGKTVSAEILPDGKILSLRFPLNGKGDSALHIEQIDNEFVASTNQLALDTRVVSQSASIRHSLFAAADEASIPDDIAIGLAEIFGGEIDFHRDLRKGDSFTVTYEVEELSGKPVRSRRILAAEFVNDGKSHLAFWFADDEKGGYYSAEGTTLRKAFLRSPLEFSRITSGFSTARYHPVLQKVRAHRGIDYAAPTGTRVRATGDGVISFAGTQGGYGKVVSIRHAGNRETLYGHLSGFATAVKVGKQIAQGETIGYVGATGLATGPHLHYEFRVGGIHRNPLTITLPPAAPLKAEALQAFRSQVSDLLDRMVVTKGFQLAKLD